MSKVKATKTIKKKSSAIFLLVVLITGTFALSLSSPLSFIIIDVQAQNAEYSEYGYNDNNYNSEYSDNKKYYPSKDPPADIVVPTDFPKIQEAMDAANEGGRNQSTTWYLH